MIQMKYMLAVFQKIPFYYNIPSKHAQEKCLNVDFLTGVQGVQKKCMFEVESSSKVFEYCQIKANDALSGDVKQILCEGHYFHRINWN